MTHTYAAKRLLEHGPLTFTEFRTIAGWRYATAQAVLRCLIETGIVVAEPCGPHRNLYRLA